MAGAAIDHLVSVTIFLAALLLFISLFNQTIQTAVIYQQHRSLATKSSDLLDTALLNPAFPLDGTPSVFGLHDPNFLMQYAVDPFSLMRLNSSTGIPTYFEKTGKMYSNTTVGSGNSLLMPMSSVVDYSSALKLLGINGTYGFQLTMTPAITFNITEARSSNSTLKLLANVRGLGFPLANASVSYRLIPVSFNGAYPNFLTIQDQAGTNYTDSSGSVSVTFSNFMPNETVSYAFVAYAQVGSVAGVGFYVPPSGDPKVIPFVDTLSTQRVILAHSYDVPNDASFANTLTYNATFVFWNQFFGLQTMALANSTGTVTSGTGSPLGAVTISNSSCNPSVLLIAYGNGAGGSIVAMPWGVGSLAFPITFGGNPAQQEWVATDMRQVMVNGIAYQAKLSLWGLQGVQVIS